MQLAFVLLTIVLPAFAASLYGRDNCPPPQTCPPDKTCPPTTPTTQFCSKCPRTDNNGHPLQNGLEQAAYTHCIYQDTDCYYGPLSDSPNTLAFSFPAGACPTILGTSVCSDPIPPPLRTLLSTRCPDTNEAVIHSPVRSQPSNTNPAITQCHYANSECYYTTSTGALIIAQSLPNGEPGCRPSLVEVHAQYGV